MNRRLRFITYGGVILAIAVMFPLLKFPQLVTGSVVNFVLLIGVHVLGLWGGVVIGCLTPWIAFVSGLMPFPFMPPFIMVGNCIYTLSFGLLQKYGKTGMIAGIVIGAFLKFLFLSFAVTHIVHAPEKLIQMMSTPQLITAIVGGAVAFIIIKRGFLPKDVLNVE